MHIICKTLKVCVIIAESDVRGLLYLLYGNGFPDAVAASACIILLFQISAHRIILAEERWCEKKFGEDYRTYRKKVRRYL